MKLPPHTPNDYSYDSKLKVPTNLGIGIQWKSKDGHEFESVVGKSEYHKNGKRKARLSLSTFVGTCAIGGMHYYARIETRSPDQLNKTENHLYSRAGYGPERPEYHLSGLRIQAQRRLTKVEKDMNGEPIGKIGDYTYRFNTEAASKAAAIRTFKRRFEPGWALVLDDIDDNGDDIIIAET